MHAQRLAYSDAKGIVFVPIGTEVAAGASVARNVTSACDAVKGGAGVLDACTNGNARGRGSGAIWGETSAGAEAADVSGNTVDTSPI